MADFVAVIRKAVDGLANNTPENRAKVYDKARSAVVRQLENMKPRPPEDLLRRQIQKLDTAISEVEGEYAEALPALEAEDEAPVPAAEDVSSPYYEPEIAQEQRYSAEADAIDTAQAEPHASYVDDERHGDTHPAAYGQVEADEHRDEEPVRHVEPADHQGDIHDEREAFVEMDERQREDAAYRDETPSYFTTASEPHLTPVEHEHSRHEPFHDETVAEDDHAHRNWTGSDSQSEDEWARSDDRQDLRDDENQHREQTLDQSSTEEYHDNKPLPYDTGYDGQSTYYGNVTVEPEEAPHPHDDRHQDDRDDAAHLAPQADGHPAQTSDLNRPKQPVVEDFSTYFQDASLDLTPKTSPALPRADEDPFAVDGKSDGKDRTPWDDLEDLIGYDGANERNDKAGTSGLDSGFTNEGIPAVAYATKKKKRRNYAGLVLGLGILVVLAGGGYAVWANRDALNDMVGGLVNSARTGTGTQSGTETASAPANQGSSTPTPAQPATTPAQPGQPSTPPATAATPDDGSVSGTKFTQRLLADGTERDEGAGPGVNGQPATAEGQSVYEQNAGPAPAATATPPGAPTAPASQPATAQATPAAKGDRMFLYEEVLGQTVPTAIEGTVSWSLQNEQDDAGKPSATVQGQITIPGRGLSALITFKRNTDPSLPASHLVEIVFSVSPGFEGGAIDSVQRIAMKSTEQDRGNALIAVPAKITDDFHMIALNDFPDARKTNLELMRTRDWIDIPVSYRNGRRALLTLQKGADGKSAFDTALREWAAAAPADGQ